MSPPVYDFALAVDAGHGGDDPGTTAGGIREADVTLAVASAVVDALATEIRTVIPTRLRDDTVSLADRVRVANAHRAWMLSIHVNSLPWWSVNRGRARGAEAHVFRAGSPGALLGVRIVGALGSAGLPLSPRGAIVEHPDLFILRKTNEPAVLVELGYATHPADRAILTDRAGQSAVAAAIVRGVLDYLAVAGVPRLGPPPGAGDVA